MPRQPGQAPPPLRKKGGRRHPGASPFYNDLFISHCGWWSPALRLSPIHLFSLSAIHFSPSFGVRLSGCLQFLLAIHLSPNLAGGVRLSGYLQIYLSPLWRQFIFLPIWLVVSGSPDFSKFICFPFEANLSVFQSGWWCPALHLSPLWSQSICLPVLLVVSGSPDIST